MTHPRKRRPQQRRLAPSRSNVRTLLAEFLEKRLLLTTVTSVDPPANSHQAPTTTDVAATFDVPINPATVTSGSFVVHGSNTGRLSGSAATVSSDGQTVTLDPTMDFFPGERVKVSATASIQSAAAEANVPRVWEFRTNVTSGSGQFVDSGQTLGVNVIWPVSFGDVDSDGDLDAVRGGGRVWMNDGSGIFTDSGQTIAAIDFELGDIDGDGDLDIVDVNEVLVNDGNGVFTPTGQDVTPTNPYSVELGDVDGDGDLDVMVGIAYSGNLVWLNNGAGSFTNSGQSLGNSSSGGIELADFDGDGDLDAFTANNGAPNRIWLNDGNGVFTAFQSMGGFSISNDLDIGDVDGDGDIDAAVAHSPQSGLTGTHIWTNDGSGMFTDSGQTLNAGVTNSVRLGDLDGDGDLDVFSPGWNGNSEVWLNDGAGTFTLAQSLTFAGPRQTNWVDLADVDGDGDLDAWEGNRNAGSARLWINQNLEPSVTLSADPPTIAEESGTATVTATLSAVHTEEVTVDLGFSGLATQSADYTTSGSQIVIPIGSTTGSVSVTAVQDNVDDDDETVIVDITGAANAQEVGTQQVTITIVDDDEPVVVPDVTLSVDNTAIPEAGGVATFTATLSAATTVAVTVDLSISGTASAADFNSSGTQIVVAPGATSGAITVTAVDDDVDEADETVIVDITSVTGGTEVGAQQQTTTITDDDEPVTPEVTLSVDNAEIAEAGGVATFAVTLSESTTVPVTVDLSFTGSASASDYTASASQVVIAPGATSGSVTVAAVDDTEDESNETVTIDIAAVTGGNETGEQQQTTTITDDDDPPKLIVTTLTPTASGFTAEFATDLNASVVNLYDTQTAGLGPADVVLQGAASGPIAGSLVIDQSLRSVTFIKSGAPLAPDAYTVTLRSAADGFVDTGGQLLDGNNDGTEGDDYSGNFEVAEPAAGSVTIGIPDIVRGPGQEVNIPADSTGIPVTISEGTNVRAVDLRIAYDPALLTITGGSVGADAPAGASVVVNSVTPGLAVVVYFSTAPLPAGSGTFVTLEASVPVADPSGIYGTQQVLDVHGVIVSDGDDNEAPTVVDDAVHLASYFADVSGNGRINAADASAVARNAALIDNGLGGALNTDPLVVGDISGNGRLNAADASLLARSSALIDVPQIPPIPAGVVIAGLGVSGLAPGLLGFVATLPPQQANHPSGRPADDPFDGSQGSADLTATSGIHYPAVDHAMTELSNPGSLDDELPMSLEATIEGLLGGAPIRPDGLDP